MHYLKLYDLMYDKNKMIKKNKIVSFRSNSRVRHILNRLRYTDKNGKVIAEHGALTDFINGLIESAFSGNEAMEISWLKHKSRLAYDRKIEAEKECIDLGFKAQEVRELAEKNGIDIGQKEKQLGLVPIKQDARKVIYNPVGRR